MISPKEVLKGCVLSHEGKPKIVKGINDFILFDGEKAWIGGSMIGGEPLSGEWMTKLGFEPDGDNEFFRQVDMSNWAIKVLKDPHLETTWIVFQGFAKQWYELRSIQFVHQLQVLYFALTGEYLSPTKVK